MLIITAKKQHFIDKPTASDTTTIIKQLQLVIHELSSRTDKVSCLVKQVLMSALCDINKDCRQQHQIISL